MEQALLANGCFWCTEAVFQRLRGVEKVESGYTGGLVANPSYEQVSSGQTGHAEALRVTFDPAVISFKDLLEVFWATHDPTTLNRQGNDVGTQYRSAVFYENEDQRQQAEQVKERLSQEEVYDQPIVTEITPAGPFYVAEDYHQNFYNDNQDYPYCRVIISPKLGKLMAQFADKVVKADKES